MAGRVWGLLTRVRELQTRVHAARIVLGSLTGLGGPPVQACGNLPEGDGRKSLAVYATYVVGSLYGFATRCGLPASTVKVTLPALDTCDGAITRLVMFDT